MMEINHFKSTHYIENMFYDWTKNTIFCAMLGILIPFVSSVVEAFKPNFIFGALTEQTIKLLNIVADLLISTQENS